MLYLREWWTIGAREVKRRRGARPASLRPTGSDRLLLHQETYGSRTERSARLRRNTLVSCNGQYIESSTQYQHVVNANFRMA